ncbi:MAG: redoxin domain-containing protein [Isosphaeraceae bacterium]
MPIITTVILLVVNGQSLAPRDDAALAASCRQRLGEIGRAITAHNRAVGRLPDALSALVPGYVPDKSSLRCPADRSASGEPGYGGHSDPQGGVSYSYETSGAPSGGLAIPPGPPPESDIPGKAWGTERNVRLWLRRYYGDRPPIVRCLHHADKDGPIALNLTLEGRVYQGATEWQHDSTTAAEFARRAARELATDRAGFAKNWKLSGISATVAGWGLAGRSETAIGPINDLAKELARNADALDDPADADRVAARLFLHARDYESAERAARSLLARRGHADEETARQLLAESQAGRGLFREAAETYRLMLKQNPQSKNIKANLADTLEASGQAAQAHELLDGIDPGRRLVGRQAPEFHTPLLSGPDTSVSDALKGKKALLINFWFLRCGPCREELPKLQRLYAELKDKGLEVLAIDSDDERDAIARYVMSSGWTFPVALGSKERRGASITALFSVELFPTNYLVDPSGKVVYRHVGWDEASMRNALGTLDVR